MTLLGRLLIALIALCAGLAAPAAQARIAPAEQTELGQVAALHAATVAETVLSAAEAFGATQVLRAPREKGKPKPPPPVVILLPSLQYVDRLLE